MKNLAALFLGLGCFALAPFARANDVTVVRLAPASAPCYVSITNDCECPVRLYVLNAQGRRYFLAQMAPGDTFCRQMGPPLPARNWLVTSTNDEELSRFTLTGRDADCVVLRCSGGESRTSTTTVRRRVDYSK